MEIDAASRTKVEDTREILDNVQYRPTRGRYKVYLIDEVHMLSNSSFNALLKTLEEPPEHVIFLLATTDPQKLPVTVLSRCLQFNLKAMTEQSINQHLSHILGHENIEFDNASIELIARAADGSMRDALSLLDQAIAFGGGKLAQQEVADMLGSVDQQFINELLAALAADDGQSLLKVSERLAGFSPNYDSVFAELISSLHRMAVAKLSNREPASESATSIELAEEDIQLFYQMGLQARNDLALAPNPRQGFEMAMLRMLAFKPKKPSDVGSIAADREKKKLRLDSDVASQPEVNKQAVTHVAEPRLASSSDQVNHTSESQASQPTQPRESVKQDDKVNSIYSSSNEQALQAAQHLTIEPASDSAPVSLSELLNSDQVSTGTGLKKPEQNTAVESISITDSSNSSMSDDRPAAEDQHSTPNRQYSAEDTAAAKRATVKSSDQQTAESSSANSQASNNQDTRVDWAIDDLLDVNNWHKAIQQLDLTGSFFQVVNNGYLSKSPDNHYQLAIIPSVEHFCTDSALQKISDGVANLVGQPVSLTMQVADETALTPKLISEQHHQQKLEQKVSEFKANKTVAKLLDTFATDISSNDIQLLDK
jgi:DNA polymerase-3 subunit gamma/tau